MKKISIITPVHVHSEQRLDDFYRCLESVRQQTYPIIEHIVVNDGSTIPFFIKNKERTILIEQPHYERIIAYNEGLKRATGDYFMFLDSDDEYDIIYCQRVVELFEEYHHEKMLNFGAVYFHKDGRVTERGPFAPARAPIGHEIFGTSNIVNGTFVFKKEVYQTLGGYPESDTMKDPRPGHEDKWLKMTSPWDFALQFQEEHPEIKPFFEVNRDDHPYGVRELGNPWGNDFALFYKYTRKYHSKPIQENLYFVHPR